MIFTMPFKAIYVAVLGTDLFWKGTGRLQRVKDVVGEKEELMGAV